jgi:hypothetical protein
MLMDLVVHLQAKVVVYLEFATDVEMQNLANSFIKILSFQIYGKKIIGIIGLVLELRFFQGFYIFRVII